MTNSQNELARKLEKLFIATHDLLVEAEEMLKSPNKDVNALLDNIGGAQEGIKRLSATVRELAIEMTGNKKEEVAATKRFNIFDDNFEEQINNASKELRNENIERGQRVKSLNPDDYPGGIDEVISLINEQIKNNKENDGDGGTYVGSK